MRSPETERTSIERELLSWMSEWASAQHAFGGEGSANDERRFDALARRLFEFQYGANQPYRRFCSARGVTPESIANWRAIPAVPAGAFKEMPLRCFPADRTQHVFRTSGTSSGGARNAPGVGSSGGASGSTIAKRGELHLDTLALYEASLQPTLDHLLFPHLDSAEDITIHVLAPHPNEAPDSSLSHMFGALVERRGDAHSGYFVREGELLSDELGCALDLACEDGRPIALCGTAFSFVHLLDAMAEAGERRVCPRGSRIMETGGFKGRSRTLRREALYGALHESLGIAPAQIVNQYGMTELGSQFYDSNLASPETPRRKLGPPWARVRIIDPETGDDIEEAERAGLVVIHDLANTGSVAAIQTADLAHWVEGDAGARGFEVRGRAEGAEARGCSIAADLMLGDTE